MVGELVVEIMFVLALIVSAVLALDLCDVSLVDVRVGGQYADDDPECGDGHSEGGFSYGRFRLSHARTLRADLIRPPPTSGRS